MIKLIIKKTVPFSGWHTLFWASFIPLIVRKISSFRENSPDWLVRLLYNDGCFKLKQIILAVGSKLQAILTRMALEISEKHAVVQGIPLVQGSDKYFWFGRPQLILHLMHFALFQVTKISHKFIP